MLFAESMIKNALIKVKKISEKLEYNKRTLDEEKVKLFTCFHDLILGCEEYRLASNSYSATLLKVIIKGLRSLDSKIEESEDIPYIKEEIQSILDLFEPIELNGNLYPSYQFERFDFDDEVNEKIYENLMRSHIKYNERSIKIFQPKCNNGKVLTAMKLNDNIETYGIEDKDRLASYAKENNTRILKGRVEGSRISNNVFDILVNNINFECYLEDNLFGGSIYKVEKRELNNTFKYLREGGIAIISMPMYRLYQDVCLIFSKQLEDVRVFKDPDTKNIHDIIYIIGKKKFQKTPRTEVYELLRSTNDMDKLLSLESINSFEYKLPDLSLSLDIFKGSRIDEEELLDIAKTSGCFNEFLENQKVEKLSETKKQPLLPFTIGQLGIVLTSGCLDGIIDEGDGHSHLVKGRVSKKVDRDRIQDEDEIEETEIVSNRVEINILLPNGDFKTLT